MFRLVLEYQFDFLANSFVVPSVLVWGQKTMFIPAKSILTRNKFRLAYGGFDKHSSW